LHHVQVADSQAFQEALAQGKCLFRNAMSEAEYLVCNDFSGEFSLSIEYLRRAYHALTYEVSHVIL